MFTSFLFAEAHALSLRPFCCDVQVIATDSLQYKLRSLDSKHISLGKMIGILHDWSSPVFLGALEVDIRNCAGLLREFVPQEIRVQVTYKRRKRQS